jgi:alpha-L-glutamate ligase-like protein
VHKTLVKHLHPGRLFLFVGSLLLAFHLSASPDLLSLVKSEKLYDFTLTMMFDPLEENVSVETFLPVSNEHQEVIRESVLSGRLKFDDTSGAEGRRGRWEGARSNQIRFHALLAMKSIDFVLDPELPLPVSQEDWLSPFLMETDGIQVSHREISQIWKAIRPGDNKKIVPVLRAIFDYTHNEIEGAEFKGFTDALTALRLGQASCNGKGRLFVALARKNGIPARLIGGVILNDGSKKTSHQWVEVYIEGAWVPFDPTNGHFGHLPDTYLQLYVGDLSLFRHTRNIGFDYLFSVDTRHLSSALFRFEPGRGAGRSVNAAQLLSLTGLNEKTIGVFLLFPMAAFAIAFLRNIIGVKTFGVFMPMLIGAACVETGLTTGLATFLGVVLFSFAGHAWLDRHHMLKVPRLAAIITMCTGLFIFMLWLFGERSPVELGILALFPVVIISFLAERVHQMASENNISGLVVSAFGAFVSTVFCYFIFVSVLLQGLFALMPELLLIVLGFQVYLGRWSGMRLTEYFRFRSIIGEGSVLGINSRNRDYIFPLNSPENLAIAADKLHSKEILQKHQVPIAKTLATCRTYRDLDAFEAALAELKSFALKPNKGSQGNGILIVTGRDGEGFVTSKGVMSIEDLGRHTAEILSGSFAQDGLEDAAYVEPLLVQVAALNEISDLGLSDIRVILHNRQTVSAMLRIPTSKSDGKANLHQGAVGVAIDLDTGRTAHASLNGGTVDVHPDTGRALVGIAVPHWAEILKIARVCANAIPLGYIGVDVCLDQDKGPIVLEVNGRPGIEIQNVQKKGLKDDLVITAQTF